MDASGLIAFYEGELRRYGPEDPRSLHWVGERTQRRRFDILYEVGPWPGMSVADIGSGLGGFVGYLEARGHRVLPARAGRRSGAATGGGSDAPVRYAGYDITPAMVAAARAKHRNAAFHLRDILAEGLAAPADYVIASGTFNIRLHDHDAFFVKMLGVMFAACRRAVAFNFLVKPSSVGDQPSAISHQPLGTLPPGGTALGRARARRRGKGPEPLAHPSSDPVTSSGHPVIASSGHPAVRPSPWDSAFYYEADPEWVLACCRRLTSQVVLRDGYLAGDCTVYLYRI